MLKLHTKIAKYIFVFCVGVWALPFVTFQREVVQAQSATSDWPMFGHDATHSGSTDASFTPRLGTKGCVLQKPAEVSPCMQFVFKKQLGEWTHGLSQPVIVSGTLFQAVMDGTLLALDAETGEQKWSFKADGAIAVTPAVIGTTIYFGDFAGNIYALDTATGKQLFPPIMAGGPIYSSPVAVTENGTIKVYIGSNDGKLYGYNGTTGELLFPPFDTQGSAIISNPAYYQGTVFFAAENMLAYALDGTTGKLRWSNKLDGESNRGDHPIVIPASNTVLFHTVPRFGNTGMGLKDQFFLYEVSGHGGRPKRTLGDLLPDYQKQVQSVPGSKSMYLFSTSTGAEVTQFSAEGKPLSMIPLNTWYANGQNFPVVLDQKDILFAAFGGYIKLDSTTGVFTIAYDGQPIRGDEYTGITVAGGWLYGAFTSNITRLRLSDKTTQQLHGCKDCGDNYPLMDAFSGAHWGGYTGDGYTDIGGYMVIANQHAYLSINGWLYAF